MMVLPMREELTRLGIPALRTAAEVDRAIPQSIRHDHGGGELDFADVPPAACVPAVRAALQHPTPSRKVIYRFCHFHG